MCTQHPLLISNVSIFFKLIYHECNCSSLWSEQKKTVKSLQDQIASTRKEIQRLKKMEEQLHSPQEVEDVSAKQTPSTKAQSKLSLRLQRKKVTRILERKVLKIFL